MQAKELIYKMLTSNTGRAVCDSGGAYGRNWERNQSKTIDDFEREPSATIEIYKYTRDDKTEWDISPSFSLYHHLKQALDLDPLCDEFNALPVDDWRGDYYGVSDAGMEWLALNEFEPVGDAFNSYNWSANFSQVVQYQQLKLWGEHYLLLQIHGGCDVRGGYTDAKLFKLDSEYGFMSESAGFCAELPNGEYMTLDWFGEWITNEGVSASDEYIKQFCELLGAGVHTGEAFELN
jgi:hypothetical protein